MRNMLEKYAALRAPAGGGGGGGTGDPGGDGGTGGDAFQYPDGFPDEFRGGTIEESLGKLFGGYGDLNRRAEGLRTDLARRPRAPDSPDAYRYDPSDKLKPFLGDMNGNPVFDQARQAFHKHGIPNEAFSGIIEDLYGPLIDQGILPQPYSPENEVRSFMKEMNLDAQAATSTLTNVEGFAKGLMGQLKGVPESVQADVQAQLLALTDTAAGNILLHSLQSRLAESGIRIAGESAIQGDLTEEDLKKLDADPRIDPANREHPDVNMRFDEALRKRYDEAYKKLSARPSTSAW